MMLTATLMEAGSWTALEVYIASGITNASHYWIRVSDGAGQVHPLFHFPSGAWPAGTFIYLASDPSAFKTDFGFDPHYSLKHTAWNGSLSSATAVQVPKGLAPRPLLHVRTQHHITPHIPPPPSSVI